MMHHKVLIVIAALIGIYQLYVTKNVFARIILACQVAGIAITFLPVTAAFITGLFIFILAGLLALVYVFIAKSIDIQKKALILLIALPVVVANIFIVNHWPGAGMLGLLMLVPVASYIYILICRLKSYKNEVGFLTVFTIDALIKILMTIEWLSLS